MNFIWNVSQHVGDNISCQNQPTDVDLVKILIVESMRPRPPMWVHPRVRVPFVIDGRMDIALAYWIRVFNDIRGSKLATEQSGIISPAHAASFGPDLWTIVKLNAIVKQVAPDVWLNLSSNPSLSPQLRRELQ